MTSYCENDFTWISPEGMAQMYKTARKNKGITQQELARKVGVNAKQVSKWENARARPSAKYIKILFETLEL